MCKPQRPVLPILWATKCNFHEFSKRRTQTGNLESFFFQFWFIITNLGSLEVDDILAMDVNDIFLCVLHALIRLTEKFIKFLLNDVNNPVGFFFCFKI